MKQQVEGEFMKSRKSDYPRFDCLSRRDVISAKVSDHHPIVHDGVIFWNMMMQAKYYPMRDEKYNNGLGIIETEEEYLKRLMKVADVIAEIVEKEPLIKAITLCEGPVKLSHKKIFLNALNTKKLAEKFSMDNGFYQPEMAGQTEWGVLMLADRGYQVSPVLVEEAEVNAILNNLEKRFQIWHLKSVDESFYLALGHFPYVRHSKEEKSHHDKRIVTDVFVDERERLSDMGKRYSKLISFLFHEYADKRLIICADFNFNPHLLGERQDRFADKIIQNNSMLLMKDESVNRLVSRPVTVDGVLLSSYEKRRYHSLTTQPGLYSRLMTEFSFFKKTIKNKIESIRHSHENLQSEYDDQFGLVLVS